MAADERRLGRKRAEKGQSVIDFRQRRLVERGRLVYLIHSKKIGKEGCISKI
mgnify:CR=1 FL=1